MLRYISGALLVVLTLMAGTILLSVILAEDPSDLSGDTENEIQVAEVLGQTVVFDADDVKEARGAYDKPQEEALYAAISPDLKVPEVTDAQAVVAHSFAEHMRAKTGAVPDPDAPDANQLVIRASGSQMKPVTDAYYTTWDDLIRRCYATVAEHSPMDETGLTAKGDERINYTEAYTEQTWFSADKAYEVNVAMQSGYHSPSGLSRKCSVKTNRFALVESSAVSQLKDRFHDWWQSERYAAATEELEYQWKLSKKHLWYGGLTRFGSTQGCRMKIEVSQMTIGRETDTSFYLWEQGREECDVGAGSGAGGKVRVNRLPQIGN